MLLSKKQAFQNAGWLDQRFRNYFKKLPMEVTLETSIRSRIFYTNKKQ